MTDMTSKPTIRPFLLMLAAPLLVLGLLAQPVSPALGQQQGQQQAGPGSQAYDEGDLRSFAAAIVEVERINTDFLPRMQAAGSEADRESVRQQATEKMIEAIEDQGLSLEEYNAIHQSAQHDPDLARDLNTMIEEAR